METVEQPIGERAGAGLTPKIALALVSAALGVVLAFAVLFPFLIGTNVDEMHRTFDLNSLRNLSKSLVSETPAPLAADGKLDVYEALRRLEKNQDSIWKCCWSARTGIGPTKQMILIGDYSEFPYERAGGPIREGDKSQLLLWDRAPDEDGNRLVARGDGSVSRLTEKEFRRLRDAN